MIDVEVGAESLVTIAQILDQAAKELRAGKMAGVGWRIVEVEPEDDDDEPYDDSEELSQADEEAFDDEDTGGNIETGDEW